MARHIDMFVTVNQTHRCFVFLPKTNNFKNYIVPALLIKYFINDYKR